MTTAFKLLVLSDSVLIQSSFILRCRYSIDYDGRID